ncbi:MAG: glycoside hydrolase family 15 protein, partial [Candidatus Eremiobacteraeota bacterium]|nr:glycoside hydrolase family 15 protein [Candidatus Eremiobacteraeota bacterium]
MPRDLPLGNGNLLINYDANYTIRDIFFPHVGTENHVLGHMCRLGFWADGNFAWTYDEGWQRELRYEADTLVTAVRLVNDKLGIAVRISDAVDFAVPMLVRRFVIEPTEVKAVRIFLGLDLYIRGNPIGDTAFYKSDLQAIVHYKEDRYFLHGGIGESGGVDQY